ncbi:ribosomal RNA small subunit methyltransferase NEP1 [Sarcoptes scabiei]|nr:ribosomal RNA small subunit methyltransferase NEP1 [Sarcoptes scabiei]
MIEVLSFRMIAKMAKTTTSITIIIILILKESFSTNDGKQERVALQKNNIKTDTDKIQRKGEKTQLYGPSFYYAHSIRFCPIFSSISSQLNQKDAFDAFNHSNTFSCSSSLNVPCWIISKSPEEEGKKMISY